MKKLILAVSLLSLHHAKAQFNNVYPLSMGGNITSSMVLDLNSEGNNNWVLSTDIATWGDIQIKRLGFGGLVQAEGVFQFPTADGVIRPHSIINTGDGGCMVVGSAFEYLSGPPNATVNPFVARFDIGGNFMWMKILPTNPAPYYHHPVCRISIIHAEDDPPNNSYIIVSPGGDANNVTNPMSCVVNAIKINDVGSVIWNRMYGTVQPNVTRNPHTVACGKSIIQVNAPGGGTVDSTVYKYYIAGLHNDANGPSMFDMTIDENGDIVDQYRTYTVPNLPEGMNAIYDVATEEFIMTYTIGHTDLTPPSLASATAVSKYAFSNLNINSTHYYYQSTAQENYGHSIIENFAGDGYVIGMNIARDNSFSPAPGGGNRFTAMLQIDKAGVPTSLTRYDKNDPDQGHRTPFLGKMQNLAGTLRYLIGSAHHTLSTWSVPFPPDHVRILSTDVNGQTCNSEDIPVEYQEMELSPVADPVPAFIIQPAEIQPQILNPISSTTPAICLLNGSAKTTSIVENEQRKGGVSVYPTLLQESDRRLNIDFSIQSNDKVQIVVCDINGRQIAIKELENVDAASHTTLDLPMISAGTYVLMIRSNNSLLQRTVKLSKL